jgi:predicted PurR-regulated permease PerM
MQEHGDTTQDMIAPATGGEEQREQGASEVRVGLSVPRSSFATVFLGALAVLSVAVLAFLTYQLLPILALVLVSILFATAIEPLVTRLRHGPFTRSTGVLVVYTGIFLTLGLIGFITVPVFLSQLSELGTAIPERLKELRENAQGIESRFVRDQVLLAIDSLNSLTNQFSQPSAPTTDEEKIATAAEATRGIAEVAFAIVTFFVVAFYWLAERPLIKRGLTSWLSPRRGARVRKVWDEIETTVGGWVRGQLTLMLIVGLVSVLGYWVLGIKYWPALAVFIAVCEAIPLVGPYIGTAPAVLVALTQTSNDGLPALLGMDEFGPITRALLVVVFAIILQTVEGNVLVPRVMRGSVGISPLAVVISILIGAGLAGLLGALLAVPIAGALQVILADIRSAREIEEKVEDVKEGVQEANQQNVEVTVATREQEPMAGTGAAPASGP